MAGDDCSQDPDEDGELTTEQKAAVEELRRMLGNLPAGRRRAFRRHLKREIDEEASQEEGRKKADEGCDP
jgi:hypothetical protein